MIAKILNSISFDANKQPDAPTVPTPPVGKLPDDFYFILPQPKDLFTTFGKGDDIVIEPPPSDKKPDDAVGLLPQPKDPLKHLSFGSTDKPVDDGKDDGVWPLPPVGRGDFDILPIAPKPGGDLPGGFLLPPSPWDYPGARPVADDATDGKDPADGIWPLPPVGKGDFYILPVYDDIWL